MRTYRKDERETLRLGFDWGDLLAGDSIASASWEIPAGITGDNAVNDDLTTDIDISGGPAPLQYRISCTITTAEGLVYERSFLVIVVDR